MQRPTQLSGILGKDTAGDPVPRGSLLKVPKQQRSVVMIHAILDHAIDLLEKSNDGRDFTTNHIAEAAGISTGSLYQYFANKEMIVSGVIERSILSSQDALRTLFQSGMTVPVDSLLTTGIQLMIDMLRPYQKVMREIFRSQPLLAETSVPAILETFLMDLIRDYLIHNQHRYTYTGGQAGMYVGVNSLVYMFLKWMVDPPIGIDEKAFIQTLVRQVMTMVEEVVEEVEELEQEGSGH